MKVLHITEAMGGGIVTALQSFVRRQTALGAEVIVAYTRRPDTPDPEVLARRLAGARLIEIEGGRAKQSLSILRLVSGARQRGISAVHLHSSIAGLVGRLGALGARGQAVFYSPHGFAFLREDTSVITRFAILWAERVLGRVGRLLVTSATERQIARDRLRLADVAQIDVGVDFEEAESTPKNDVRESGRLVVAMIGRVAYQKAPWRFAQVARKLDELAEFRWYGANSEDRENEWFADSPVTFVGWLSADQLEAEMQKIDLVLFPSLWEGMPYGLMMSQVRGIPAVVSDVVGNRDAVADGATGYVAANDNELADSVEKLLRDSALRGKFSVAGRERALRVLTDRKLGEQTLGIYFGRASE